ncbi:MAG: redoxin domain-containing protein [Pseudomonadota bacterium]|nr:redoxin domain-containing protein [Pseudomonadota bacterium]
MLTSLAAALTTAGLPVDEAGAATVLGWLVVVLGLVALGLALRRTMNLKIWFGGLALAAPLVLVLGLAFQNDPHQIDSPLVGKTAPDFTLSPIDGSAPVRLSEQRGMPTVVNFWATWCEPCKAEHRTLVAVARRMEGKARFFGVVYQDEVAKIDAWLDKMGSAYPQLLDVGSKAAIAYGVYGVPETYIIDGNGVITYKFTGPVEAGALMQQLAPLVGS